ncbi:hypothetical protein FJ987_01995 [Mesorhizobium sp. CU2]|uniref:hypothetical protein n=1 Tax=unclassified Mesorhizobium TaxID=325217 RepID=UPI00112D0C12|nr:MULTISPECIES: hypothetical protein [unclassified Mesorhizobium]TPN88607.1 hypothetical protein FJ988_06085 [Mesorhizobium sp. CU3]TPO21604.1 hypothetical protein FJ987_01995 [Mesorhizobium sp. CU2]
MLKTRRDGRSLRAKAVSDGPTPSARGQARGDDQGAAMSAREASASGTHVVASRSAPEGPPRLDATGPRIIRARDVKYDDVKRETKRKIDA